jgi:hypothetical protein
LNIDFGIKNERTVKIGTVCGRVLTGGERMNKGGEGEGIWLDGLHIHG